MSITGHGLNYRLRVDGIPVELPSFAIDTTPTPAPIVLKMSKRQWRQFRAFVERELGMAGHAPGLRLGYWDRFCRDTDGGPNEATRALMEPRWRQRLEARRKGTARLWAANEADGWAANKASDVSVSQLRRYYRSRRGRHSQAVLDAVFG